MRELRKATYDCLCLYDSLPKSVTAKGVDVWQKLTQYCSAIMLQLKINKFNYIHIYIYIRITTNC